MSSYSKPKEHAVVLRRVSNRLRTVFGLHKATSSLDAGRIMLTKPHFGIFVILVLVIFCARMSLQPQPNRSACGREQVSDGDEDTQFTVLVNTFKRPDNLKAAIKHYATCPEVASIHVVWSEQAPPPERRAPGGEEFFSGCVEVVYDTHPTASLNNRFAPPPALRSDAVLSVDDDMRVSCASLRFAHEVWREHPRQLVGFLPRAAVQRRAGGAGAELQWQYRRWWTVWWTGAYSIILTKACFLHREYLRVYTEESPRAMLEFVENARNCEDIAMQFAVSNRTGTGPVWVQGSYVDTGGFAGISTTGGHRNFRSECVAKFVEFYGRNPLVESHSFVQQAHSWSNFFNVPHWMEWFALP